MWARLCNLPLQPSRKWREIQDLLSSFKNINAEPLPLWSCVCDVEPNHLWILTRTGQQRTIQEVSTNATVYVVKVSEYPATTGLACQLNSQLVHWCLFNYFLYLFLTSNNSIVTLLKVGVGLSCLFCILCCLLLIVYVSIAASLRMKVVCYYWFNNN